MAVVLLAVVFIVSQADSDEAVIWKDGVPMLSPQRKAKMEREIEDLNVAEQYVLKAGVAAYYPCYSCPESGTIWLYVNEVWKYGVTTKSPTQRYGLKLPHPGLLYEVQYESDLTSCLKREKIQIYHYALLPENLKRPFLLKRPPGNKIDR